MFRQCELMFLSVVTICLVAGLVVWGVDRSETVKWIGVTDLTVEFRVTNADSGEPIANAALKIQSEGGFYEGGHEAEGIFELRTDDAGVAHRILRNNCCIGSVSRLRFTDTRHVYVPSWLVSAQADGFDPSESIDFYSDYRGKAQRMGEYQDRLVVPIALRKSAKK